MYHQIEGGPSIVCVNQSFAVGFLKTLGVPWTSALWRHLWFMIIPWLRGTTTFSNKQWHIISSYSSCFLGKSKQYWLSNPSQNVAIAVGSHGATIPAPGFFLIPVTQDRKKYDLVGGWPTPLKNMKVSWDDYSIYIYIHIMENKKCLNHQPVMQWCNVLSFYMFAIPLHENVNPLEWTKRLNDVECWYLVTLKWYMLIGDTDIWQLTSLSVTHAGDISTLKWY